MEMNSPPDPPPSNKILTDPTSDPWCNQNIVPTFCPWCNQNIVPTFGPWCNQNIVPTFGPWCNQNIVPTLGPWCNQNIVSTQITCCKVNQYIRSQCKTLVLYLLYKFIQLKNINFVDLFKTFDI